MKRFLIIFVICFFSLVGVIGTIVGIKALKGDFKTPIITPENIMFDDGATSYDVDSDFTITINTTTENVTVDEVFLSFEGPYSTVSGTDYYTNGSIMIPKAVRIGVPFTVKVCKTKETFTIPGTNQTETLDWNVGGVSVIKAESEHDITEFKKATVNVDVPVYSAELVSMAGFGNLSKTGNVSKNDTEKTFLDYFTNIETGENNTNNSLVKPLKSVNDIPNVTIDAGSTFYLGVNYQPARSAFKYSKISSTNLFVEYYDEIIKKLQDLNLDYTNKIQAIKNLFNSSNEYLNIDINTLVYLLEDILDFDNNEISKKEFTSYINELNTQFKSNLKYYTFEENNTSLSQKFISNIKRVEGTNLFKVEVTDDVSLLSENQKVGFYSYIIGLSKTQDVLFANYDYVEQYSELIGQIEKDYGAQAGDLPIKPIHRYSDKFKLVDVYVDTLSADGQVKNFDINQTHTIYAVKSESEQSEVESYLNLKLSNSSIPNIDLQQSVKNIAINFTVKLSGSENYVDAKDYIKFVNEENYNTVLVGENLYYFPIGAENLYTNAYWEIYAKNLTSNDLIKMTINYIMDDNTISGQSIYKDFYIVDNQSKNEKMVSWSQSSVNLSYIDLKNVSLLQNSANEDFKDEAGINRDATQDVTIANSIDLANFVNIDDENLFKLYRIFLYTENNSINISDYFQNIKGNSDYSLNSKSTTLYELNGTVLQLKKAQEGTDNLNDVRIIFATVKTDANGRIIINSNNQYEISKWSSIATGSFETLSYISVVYEQTLNTLSQYHTVDIAGVQTECLKPIEVKLLTKTYGNSADNKTEVENSQFLLDYYIDDTNSQNNHAISIVGLNAIKNENIFSIEITKAYFNNNQDTFDLFKRHLQDGKISLIARNIKDLQSVSKNIKTSYEINGDKILFTLCSSDFKSEDFTPENPRHTFKLYFNYELNNKNYLFEISMLDTYYSDIYNSLSEEQKGRASSITYVNGFNVYNGEMVYSLRYNKSIDKDKGVVIFSSVSSKQEDIKFNISNSYDGDSFTKSYSLYYTNIKDDERSILGFLDESSKFKLIAYISYYDYSDDNNKIFGALESKGYFNSYKVVVPENQNSVVVNPDNNQSISLGSSGETTVDFYLIDGTSENQKMLSLTLGIEKNGYVSSYTTQTVKNSSEVSKNYGEGEYSFEKISLTIDQISAGETLNLSHAESPNWQLLTMMYTIGADTVDINDLKCYAANSTTLEKYNELTGSNKTISDSLDVLVLENNLGAEVNLKLMFKSEALDINQAVDLKIKPTDKLQSTTVKYNGVDESNNQKLITLSLVNDYYNIYAGIPYTVELTSNATKLYLIQNGDVNFTINGSTDTGENSNGDTYYELNSTFIITFNEDVIGDVSFTISNTSSCKTGDLSKPLKFYVSSNLQAIANIEDKTLTGSTLTLKLSDVLKRITQCYEFINTDSLVLHGISTFTVVDKYTDSKIQSITYDYNEEEFTLTFNEFTNKTSVLLDITFGTITVNNVKFDVYPEKITNSANFVKYDGNDAILIENGFDLNDGYEKNINNYIKAQFNASKDVSVTLKNGTFAYINTSGKVSTSNTTNAFFNTGLIAQVTYSGVTKEYLIVINNITFPFVNLGITTDYSNLDVNKLFNNNIIQSDFNTQLLKYYQELTSNNLITLPVLNYCGDSIDLGVDGTPAVVSGTITSITNLDKTQLTVNSVTVLGDNYVPNACITVDETNKKLVASYAGEDVFVKVNLTYNKIEFPIVIKVLQNEKLFVKYPDSTNVDIQNITDEQQIKNNLIADSSNFALKNMQYGEFDNNGECVFDLRNLNKYKITRHENNTTEWNILDLQNNNFTYELEYIAYKDTNSWKFIEFGSFNLYSEISNGIIKLKHNNKSVVRVVVKVITTNGAINRYYISAGEIPSLNLKYQFADYNRNYVLSDEYLSVAKGDVINIGKVDDTNRSFYFADNTLNSELKFRLVGDITENIYFTVASKTAGDIGNSITINTMPDGGNFKLEIYTIYGVLTTLNITVEQAYEFVINTNVYSATTYGISDLITIKEDGNNVTGITCSFTNTTDEAYYVITSDSITFKACDRYPKQLTLDLELAITVDGNTYNVKLQNIEFTVSNALAVKHVDGYRHNQNRIVNLNTISITEIFTNNATIWSTLFTDNNTGASLTSTGTKLDFNNLYYNISNQYGDTLTGLLTNTGNIIFTFNNIITAESSMNFTVKIVYNGTELISTTVILNILPLYSVQTNYPNYIDANGNPDILTFEYAKVGDTIDLFAKNDLSDYERVVISKNDTTPPEILTGDNASGSFSDYAFEVRYNGSLLETAVVNNYFTISGSEITFTNTTGLDTTGTYTISVQIKDASNNYHEFGIYVVEVVNNNLYKVESASQEGINIYQGFGENNILGYVDLIVTLPTTNLITEGSIINLKALSKELNGSEPQYLDIYGLSSTNGSEDYQIYYKGNEKIRVELTNNDYAKLEKFIIVYGATAGGTPISLDITTVTANARIKVTYANMYHIDTKYYTNIIKEINISDVKDSNDESIKLNGEGVKYTVEHKNSSTSIGEITINYLSNIVINNVKLNSVQANSGDLSLIDSYNIQDSLGNKLWFNALINENYKLNIHLGTSNSTLYYILQTPQKEDAGDIIYDYLIKPLGADNDNGSEAEITLTFGTDEEVGQIQQKLTMVVKPDINVVTSNNDNTGTNSQYNPLKIYHSEPIVSGNPYIITLTSVEITSYIHAYYKHLNTNNNAHLFDFVVNDGNVYSDFIVVERDETLPNKPIVIKLLNNATFGDKNLVVTFKDQFGYTFDYYITYKATNSVEDIVLDLGSRPAGGETGVFEEDSINVGTSDNSEFMIYLTQALEPGQSIIISDVEFYRNGVSMPNVVETSGSQIKFKTLNSTVWESEPENFITGELRVTFYISGHSDETYTFKQEMTIYRRYIAYILEENTYIRENVETNLVHYITVKDQKNNLVLGEASLETKNMLFAKEITAPATPASTTITAPSADSDYLKSQHDVNIDMFNIDLTTNKTENKINLKTYLESELNTKDLTQNNNLSKDNLTDVEYKELLNKYSLFDLKAFLKNKLADPTGNATAIKNIKSLINTKLSDMNVYGIRCENDEEIINSSTSDFELSDFKIDLVVKAHHKTSGKNYYYTISNLVITDTYNIVFEMKSVDEIFSRQDISTNNYDLELYLCNINNKLPTTNTSLIASSNKTEVGSIKLGIGSLTEVSLGIPDSTTLSSETIYVKEKNSDTPIALNIAQLNTNSKKIYYLFNKELELFTGNVNISGTTTIVNGLDVATTQTLKYISEIEVSNQTENIYKLNETSDLRLDEEKNILYQELNKDFTVTFTDNNYIKFNDNLRVTPKYTSVNTNNAYVSTDINIISGFNFEDIVNQDLSLDKWSKDFALNCGTGVAEILSKLEGENKNFFKTDNSKQGELTFAIEKIADITGGGVASNNIASITEDGVLKLTSEFIPNQHYISIKVIYNYAHDGSSYKKQVAIGTVNITFVDCDPVTITVNTGLNTTTYNINLSQLISENSTIDKTKDVYINGVNYGTIVQTTNIVTSTNTNLNNFKNGDVYSIKIGNFEKKIVVNLYKLTGSEQFTSSASEREEGTPATIYYAYTFTFSSTIKLNNEALLNSDSLKISYYSQDGQGQITEVEIPITSYEVVSGQSIITLSEITTEFGFGAIFKITYTENSISTYFTSTLKVETTPST